MARNVHLVVGSFLSTVRYLDDDVVEEFAAELRSKLTERERAGIELLRRVLSREVDDAPLIAVAPPSLAELREAVRSGGLAWGSNVLHGTVLTSLATYGTAEVRRRVDKRTGRARYDARIAGADDRDFVAFTLDGEGEWQDDVGDEESAGDYVEDDVEVVTTPGAPAATPSDDELREMLRVATVPWENLGVRDGAKWSRATIGELIVTRTVSLADGGVRHEVRRGDRPPYPLVMPNDDTLRNQVDA